MRSSFCSPENLIEKIENPNDESLAKLLVKAKENAEKNFPKEKDKNLIKKLSYVFYSPKNNNPEFMLILQNPGFFKKSDESDKKEKERIKEVFQNSQELAAFFNEGLEEWFLVKNKNFAHKFFNIINKGRKDEITNENFLEYMYFTDLVKYRANTTYIKTGKKGNAEASFEEFIKAEIKELKPKLIFTFSKRTWEIIERKMGPKLVKENVKDSNLSAVTKVHGSLYKSQDPDVYIIPLAHFSGRNSFLRNSYFDYLKEGVTAYYKLKK